MLNKTKKVLIFMLSSLFIYLFISNPNIIIDSVNASLDIFINNIFVSLFPFFLLADILINYNYIYYLSKIFKFKYSYIILMSMISGLPSNAKYISNLLDNNQISTHDAEILLSITFFPNPMFVIGTVGTIMMNNTKLGIILLINIYLSNLILYIYYYNKLERKNITINTNQLAFPNLLKESILKNINTLLVILGTIVLFILLSNIIFNYIKLNPLIQSIIASLLEMTSGIKKISILSLNTNLKFTLISTSLMFSGLSIITQALSILSDYKLNIKFILKNKLFLILINLIFSISTCIIYHYFIWASWRSIA